MKRILLICAFALLFALPANAQQCSTVAECNALVDKLTQALNKTLDVNRSNESLITAQGGQILAQKEQIAAQERLIAVKDAVGKEQEKLIEFYRKQTCDKTSFLWGIIKTTRCSVR